MSGGVLQKMLFLLLSCMPVLRSSVTHGLMSSVDEDNLLRADSRNRI